MLEEDLSKNVYIANAVGLFLLVEPGMNQMI